MAFEYGFDLYHDKAVGEAMEYLREVEKKGLCVDMYKTGEADHKSRWGYAIIQWKKHRGQWDGSLTDENIAGIKYFFNNESKNG